MNKKIITVSSLAVALLASAAYSRPAPSMPERLKDRASANKAAPASTELSQRKGSQSTDVLVPTRHAGTRKVHLNHDSLKQRPLGLSVRGKVEGYAFSSVLLREFDDLQVIIIRIPELGEYTRVTLENGTVKSVEEIPATNLPTQTIIPEDAQ
jgi:hypothetical protein